jgi:hypothetical protein
MIFRGYGVARKPVNVKRTPILPLKDTLVHVKIGNSVRREGKNVRRRVITDPVVTKRIKPRLGAGTPGTLV